MWFRSWFDVLGIGTQPRRSRPSQRSGDRRRQMARRLLVEGLEQRQMLAFLPAVDFPVGASPVAVVTADFNGGGADIAVANYGGNGVSVLLGDGLGGFGANYFATGTNPRSLVVGDVSGDGKIDLITANATDVSILRGDGAGSFALPDSIPLPGQFPPSGYLGADPLAQSPHSVATGDFNADGRLDLAVTGVTSFQRLFYDWYGDPYYSQFENYYVNVLLSNGSGGFQPTVTTTLYGLYPDSIAVGRFNADAKDDLAITHSVLLSDGAGGFSASARFDTYSQWMAAGDVNGDLKTDLVAASRYLNDVRVLLGDGLGGFAAAQNYAVGSGITSGVLGDFNHDTKLDIVAVNEDDDNVGYVVSVLLGNGDGTFQPARDYGASDYPLSVAVGDFNGDGWLDVATANVSGTSSVLINDQSWLFIPPAVSVSDVTVTEGNTGTVNATFTLTLSAASNIDVTIHYATANITAVAGSDYTAASGNVIVPAGQLSRTFTIAVKGDRLAEPNETFFVNLSSPTNATIADGQGLGTILDDEPRISISDVSKSEGNKGRTTLFTFTVTLSAAYDQPVTMSYRTVNGTAKTSDGDYIAKTGTLTFAPGQTTKTITIEVKGDSKREASETFYLDLFGNSSNSQFTKNRGLGTILNDD